MADKPTMWRDQLQSMIQVFGTSILQSRADIMAKAGTTFGGNRKHYEIFGWPVAPDFDTYEHLYKRGGIAKRIVNAYPFATWRKAPVITEQGKPKDSTEDTTFEKVWKDFVDKRKVFHYLERVDRMARLGEHAVLFLGYADGAQYGELQEPVRMVNGANPWDKLLYLTPYNQNKATVQTWEEDPANPRFGLPKLYQIQFNVSGRGSNIATQTVLVHYSRVLHIAEDVMDSDTEGAPALESVLNYVLDLEKTHGSVAESFFQQQPPGLVLSADKDGHFDPTDAEAQTLVNDFIHGLKRFLLLQGMDVTEIKPNIGDPTATKDTLLELISGTTGIPKRILVGSERGELASSQDETAWNQRVMERQQNWAEPFVLRPFIDAMLEKGVLPPLRYEGYQIEWQEQEALGDLQKAEISEKKSNAISKFAGTPGADQLVPVKIFLREVMGFSEEAIEQCEDLLEELWDKDLEEAMNPPEPVLLPSPAAPVTRGPRPRTAPVPGA